MRLPRVNMVVKAGPSFSVHYEGRSEGYIVVGYIVVGDVALSFTRLPNADVMEDANLLQVHGARHQRHQGDHDARIGPVIEIHGDSAGCDDGDVTDAVAGQVAHDVQDVLEIICQFQELQHRFSRSKFRPVGVYTIYGPR